MNDAAVPSPEMCELLKAYEAIQQEEKALHERKSALREKLVETMRERNAAEWLPRVDGRLFKVRYRHAITIDYDEDTLRHRLGDRYRQVLAPDPRKLRAHLAEVAPLLEPQLDVVGSPSPEKVKAAIDAGVVSADEFKGAFEKTEKHYITVSQPEPRPASE